MADNQLRVVLLSDIIWYNIIVTVAVFSTITWLGFAIKSIAVTAKTNREMKPNEVKEAVSRTPLKTVLSIIVGAPIAIFVVSTMILGGHSSVCPSSLVEEYCLKTRPGTYIVVPKLVYYWSTSIFFLTCISVLILIVLWLFSLRNRGRLDGT